MVTRNKRLPDAGKRLIIGVNSFGFGGTNAHAVVEAHSAVKTPAVKRHLPADLPPLLLSARTPDALTAMAGLYTERIKGLGKGAYYDVAWSVANIRDSLPHRLVVRGGSVEEIRDRLLILGEGG